MQELQGFPECVYWFFVIGSSLSLASSFVSIIYYLTHKNLHILVLKIVFLAHCSNFFVSLTGLTCFIVMSLECENSYTLCIANSFFMNFFNILAIFLVTNISIILYISIFYAHLELAKITNINNYCIFFYIGLSALLSLM